MKKNILIIGGSLRAKSFNKSSGMNLIAGNWKGKIQF